MIDAICVFRKDEDGKVEDAWNVECKWVEENKGEAFIKYDGITVRLLRDGGPGTLYGFALYKLDEDKEKRIILGVDDDWRILEAFRDLVTTTPRNKVDDGIYECVGPGVKNNPQKLHKLMLIKHDANTIGLGPRSYQTMKNFLQRIEIAGILFKHEDGRTAEITRKDFGFTWPA